MFCKNCGNQLDNNTAFCTKCGAKTDQGNRFCPNCGQQTNADTSVCAYCGVSLTGQQTSAQKSKVAAGLLGIFLGALGVHNFYLGYTRKAMTQLLMTVLTCGFLSPVSQIWGFVEGILILTGNTITTDAQGIPLKD